MSATRRVMVRYRVKPGRAEENEELVRAVYAELAAKQPAGMRYSTSRLEDGVSFVHLHESNGEAQALSEFDAFREFQREIADRCEEPPVVTELTEVGSYRTAV
jgi:quinol monooxygenase YgiN